MAVALAEPISHVRLIKQKTIGIVTTCHSYYSFLDGWLASIQELSTKPDQIVIAATDPDQCSAFIPAKYSNVKVVQGTEPFWIARYLNAAIEACETDWIVWIGLDDRYRSCALDGIRSSSADVVAFGMQFANGTPWIPYNVTAEQILTVRSNLIPCGSPFRRNLWEQIPFQEHLSPFEDWALWVGFAALGARFTATNQIDFDYSQHPEQIVPPMEPTRTRILEWSQTLKT